MTVYRYRLIAPDGTTATGEFEGGDPEAVREQLEAAGGVVVSLRRALSMPRLRGAVGDAELAVWTRELSVLLRSGVPLLDAVQLAGDRESVLDAAARSLAADVREGRGLSKAMANDRDVFSPAMVAAVHAGERSGDLAGVLERLSVSLAQRSQLAGRIQAALLYPAVLCCLACGVLAFLVGYVVPNFAGILADSHARLPLLTRTVLLVADLARAHSSLLAAVGVAALVLANRLYRRDDTGSRVDRILCELPWGGAILRTASTATWAETMALLLGGAVPAAEALPLAARAVSNRHLSSELLALGARIEQGQSLSQAALHCDALPVRARRMIAIGEEAGELVRMLSELALLEAESARNRLEVFTRLLEPMLNSAVRASLAQ